MAAAALLMLPLASTAQAQDQVPSEETPDVSRLSLDLDRIQRGLHESATRGERGGQAPSPVFFRSGADLVNGPVPRSAPTHDEMVAQMTPREFRAPAADVSALFRWLAERGNGKDR